MTSTGERYLDDIKSELQSGRNQWKRGDKILEAFGYKRRRQSFVDQINRELERRGMVAVPPISTELELDGFTSFRLTSPLAPRPGAATPPMPPPETEPSAEEVAAEEESELEGPPQVDIANPADLSLTVGNLDCAEREPLCINPTASVEEALTLMQMRDYSQLVVRTTQRDIQGIVSYRSIARAQLLSRPHTVADCIDASVPRVGLDRPLLDVISQFERHDCTEVARSPRRAR